MIYECDQCSKALPPSVTACPTCGETFEDAVPADAEVPCKAVRKGFTAVNPRPAPAHGGGYDWLDAPATDPNAIPDWPAVPKSAKRQPNLAAVVLAWIVICGGLAAAWVSLTSHSNSEAASSPDTISPSQNASQTLSVGDDGVVTYGDNTDVIVAATEQAEDDMSSAAAAKDKVGYTQIANSDRTYLVASGTSAKLIGYGSGLLGAAVYHVRIQGGSHDTQDGWIPMESMKKQ